MTLAAIEHSTAYLRALPGDDVRQILWRFADRYDLQMLVQSARAVARGPVARLVAAGARHTHEWTAAKNDLRSCGASRTVTTCRCWYNRRARWRVDRWRGWWPRGHAIRTNGPRRRTP